MVELRPLGNTGIKIAPLVLGGGVFGLAMDQSRSFPVLDAFVAHGGTMIDTADIYVAHLPGGKGGESETMIGQWLAKRGRRDDLQIGTKVGGPSGGQKANLRADYIVQSIEGSLRRLQTDYVDVYFAHVDDPNTPQDEVAEGFDRVIKSGKARVAGASNLKPGRLTSALDIAKARNLQPFRVYQPDYNLLDRGFEENYKQIILDNNIGVVTYFALAQGYLSGKYRTATDLTDSYKSAGAKRYMEGKGPAVLAVMDAIAAERGFNLATIALAWVKSKPFITAPIASATSVKQLEEFMPVLELNLTVEDIARLDAAGA